MALERNFQKDVLIPAIQDAFPDCLILKNDSSYMQGIPDLTVLNGRHWVVLEVKRSANSPYRPNQEYYIRLLNGMGMSCTVHPGNLDKVIALMDSYFAELDSVCVAG